MSTFSADFGTVFSSAIGLPLTEPTTNIQTQINGAVVAKDLSSEQKDKRKLAKRIIKAVQCSLEDAMRKESELCRKPFEKELRELDLLLENSVLSRRDSITGSLGEDVSDDEGAGPQPLIKGPESTIEMTNGDGNEDKDSTAILGQAALKPQDYGDPGEADVGLGTSQMQAEVHERGISDRPELPEANLREKGVSIPDVVTKWSVHQDDKRAAEVAKDSVPLINGLGGTAGDSKAQGAAMNVIESSSQPAALHPVPPTPPLSSEGDPLAPLTQGGIPWYMDPFDPIGTTIHEERWTGREVVRCMSEELSDMDEEELQGLVDEEMADPAQGGAGGSLNPGSVAAPARRKAGGKRRRWRGFR